MKALLIGSYILSKIYHGILEYLDSSYIEKELPDNVKDVYDKDTYDKYIC